MTDDAPMTPETTRLFGNDILIQHVDMNEVEKGQIILSETADNQNQYFKIIKTGKDVEEVQEGDTVLIPWGRITLPFMMDDGYRYGISSWHEVIAVIEEEDKEEE